MTGQDEAWRNVLEVAETVSSLYRSPRFLDASIRWILKDKVSRAFRLSDQRASALELALFDPWAREQLRVRNTLREVVFSRPLIRGGVKLAGYIHLLVYRLFNVFKSRSSRVFLMQEHRSLAEVYEPIRKKFDECWQFSANYSAEGFLQLTWPHSFHTEDPELVLQVYRKIDRELEQRGIHLLVLDKALMMEELKVALHHHCALEYEIDLISPQLVITPMDNTPEGASLCEIASKRGIPSLHLIHGLDCELGVYDEAYASHVFTRGEFRKDRYERDSVHQPRYFFLSGQSSLENRAVPEGCSKKRDWMWVTRPHGPSKCYTLNRSSQEGVEILNALLELLNEVGDDTKLFIKAHPFDYEYIYRSLVVSLKMDDRVLFSTHESFDNDVSSCSLVLTEDSTAGVEFLTFGLPMALVHFSDDEPVIPFSEKGAFPVCSDIDSLRAFLLQTPIADPVKALELYNYCLGGGVLESEFDRVLQEILNEQ